VGEAAAVSQKWVAAYFGVNERRVREMVCAARSQGAAIASSAAGYWLPNFLTDEGIADAARYHRAVKRAENTRRRQHAAFVRALAQAKSIDGNQLQFDEI